jgi:hypothetical protein
MLFKHPQSGSPKSRISNAKGQGAVEFILILVIVSGIALGIVYQFNDAFGKFVGSYIGEYLACLIESGELPSLGGKQAGACESLYEEFSLANGRPPKDSTESADQDSKEASDQGRAKTASAGRVGSDFGRQGRPNSFAASGAEGGAVGGGGASSENKSEGGEEFSNMGSQSGNGLKRPRKMLASGAEKQNYVNEKDKNKDKKSNVKAKETATDENASLKKKVMPYRPKESENKAEEAEKPFTFGNFLRYLIISAIIIAIVIFFGSQALQISKSSE